MEVRSLAAAVAWTAVIALALARALTHEQGLTLWALLLGQVAMVLTGWIILESVVVRLHKEAMRQYHEMNDRTVERVASRLAEALREEEPSRIH